MKQVINILLCSRKYLLIDTRYSINHRLLDLYIYMLIEIKQTFTNPQTCKVYVLFQ